MEAKLIKLLAPIEKDEQSLMKLDAIFNVSWSKGKVVEYNKAYSQDIKSGKGKKIFHPDSVCSNGHDYIFLYVRNSFCSILFLYTLI